MYHAQAQLHSCNQFHKRNATHDSEGKDKACHIFRSSYSLRTKSFKASLEYLQRFNLLENSSHCGALLIYADITFIKSKCFHCSVLAAVIVRFVTQSNLNFGIYCLPCNLHQIAPKLQEIVVCCTEVFKALQIVEIHICRTKHKSSQKLTIPTY